MFRPPSRVRVRRPPVRRGRTPSVLALMLAVLLVAVLGGCAQFPDNGPRQWRDKSIGGGQLIEPPKIPQESPESPQQQPTPAPPKPNQGPVGCDDPDPLVIATCLNSVSAIAVLPDGETALAAERTGSIFQVQQGKKSKLVATVPVDAAHGGILGLVLSPTFDQDQLLYGLIATPGDLRVIRLTTNGMVTPVLTGIPRGSDGDGGALGVDPRGALLVATPATGASAPTSLDGKVLRIDAFGRPFPGNPAPNSPIYSTGLRSPSGMCTAPDNGSVWLTDRQPNQDALFRVIPGPLAPPAWNWPDKPGVAGCAAMSGIVAVAQRDRSLLFELPTTPNMSQFTGKPLAVLQGKYGHLDAATLGPGPFIWLGTSNKGSGGPVASSDDRVIKLLLVPSGGSGAGPD